MSKFWELSLSPRDVRILKYIIDSHERRNVSPTYREILLKFKFSSTEQVIRSTNRLKLRGLLENDPKLYRNYRNLYPTDLASKYINEMLQDLEYFESPDEGAEI